MTSQQLQDSILDLAVKGILVKQDLSHSGQELVKEIIHYKQELVKTKKTKKDKPLKPIDVEEIGFSLPSNWGLVRLGDIISVYGGKRIPAGRNLINEDNGYKYIRVTDMKNYSVDTSNLKFVPTDVYDSIKKYTISKDDVYITVAGTIGRVGIIPEELDGANLTENADKLVIYNLNKEWLMFFMDSPFIQNQIKNATKQMGQPKLSIVNIQNLIIPVPPLEEQFRIVDKIKQLIPYIQEYSKIESVLRNYQVEFPLQISKSILFQAVQGKISSGVKFEDNIESTLDCIFKSKKQAIKNGLIIDKKHTPDFIKEDEIPFEIPNSWKWVKLGDITTFYAGKTPERHNTSYWQNATMPWVSITDMVSNGITTETKEKISDIAVKDCLQKCVSPKGTLIMSFKLTIGKVSYLGVDATHNEAIISIFPFAKDKELNILKDYLFTILPFMANYGESKNAIKGRTLNATSLTNLYIPLPSFEEQEYIVNKVKELKNLVNSLN